METLPTIPEWITLEHEAAEILTTQELHGWYFDERSAWQLASTLRQELEETYQLLRDRHPYVAGPVFVPKRDNRTQGYVKDAPLTRKWELIEAEINKCEILCANCHAIHSHKEGHYYTGMGRLRT